jgi:hypothetical protein
MCITPESTEIREVMETVNSQVSAMQKMPKQKNKERTTILKYGCKK